MHFLLAPFETRNLPLTLSMAMTVVCAVAFAIWPEFALFIAVPFVVFAGLSLLGLRDVMQARHAILRNYPILAHLRFISEKIRPEMRQYFFEGEKDGLPFSRDKRAIVYQRAKKQLDKRPFGTQYEVYQDSFEWVTHSMAPKSVNDEPLRIEVGGPDCKQPYSSSLLNISGMSFGALSPNAVRALNKGAKIGGFSHTTGEGSVSEYHTMHGGDLVWQIGSGYFGCRDEHGQFCPDKFAEVAQLDQVKMIEIKMSQGAKPGHGGVLPKAKINAEIARARGIPRDRDCVSPAFHSAFSTPMEMMLFIARLRHLSGGKPVGFKFCVGHPWEFMSIVKAMLATGVTPDFIVVDGKEGGTGAAPLEFADHVGMPLRDGLSFVHNTLVGAGVRDRIKLGASGKIISGFDMARVMALGADYCNAARGFMFAVGCIQAQTCHTGKCPVGVTTQDPSRWRAIVVRDKAKRVANFHKATVEALAELVAAAGLSRPGDLAPEHLYRRVSQQEYVTFAQLYPSLKEGELLSGSNDKRFQDPWMAASAETFQYLPSRRDGGEKTRIFEQMPPSGLSSEAIQ
ncbi:MAG: FMN-binding glutamate synthase family protein [Filomicrobium sp.]